MFLSGVIEGFYGRAWSGAQRVEMLDWIGAAGMNTFVYGPKDDIKIRARWRETYTAAEAAELQKLVDAAAVREQQFLGGHRTQSRRRLLGRKRRRRAGPADRPASGTRRAALSCCCSTTFRAPCGDEDVAAFGTLAAAQAAFANAAFRYLRSKAPDGMMLFCPTEYCAAFVGHDVVGSAYLNEIGEKLAPEIGVFWTGPDIVSETISADSLREIGGVLRRKPVIWDNFHANDYDIRRVYAGPLGGRGDEILPLIDGLITNPNNEFEANFVAVRTHRGAGARRL